jgi:hypothetical protein
MAVAKETERTLTMELKKKMDESGNFGKIYFWKRPGRSPAFMKRWLEVHGKTMAPPVQPDMDLIVFWQGLVIGIEIKYFRRKGKRLATSFYEGLDQAVALLGWGFDRVALWQMFETEATAQELWFYGAEKWSLIQKPLAEGGLGLPIEFTFMKVERQADGHIFTPFNAFSNQETAFLVPTRVPLHDPKFQFRAPHPNPLANLPSVRKRREVLFEWLATQNPA